GPSSAARTIRRTVLGSCTKFCPSRLVGRTPSSPASARTSAGPSNRDSCSLTGPACPLPRDRPAPPPRTVAGGLAGQAELAGAGGPGAVAAAVVDDLVRHRHLLLGAGLVGQRGVGVAAVGLPGARVELQAAVVA